MRAFLPQSTILVSAIRGLRPLGAISPHVPNVRVHSHVSLFSRNVWSSKVMYRGSAVNALVVLGIPPQMRSIRGTRTTNPREEYFEVSGVL